MNDFFAASVDGSSAPSLIDEIGRALRHDFSAAERSSGLSSRVGPHALSSGQVHKPRPRAPYMAKNATQLARAFNRLLDRR